MSEVKTYHIEKGEIKDFSIKKLEVGKYSFSLNGYTMSDLIINDNVEEKILDVAWNVGYLFGLYSMAYNVKRDNIFGLFKIWRQDED